MIDEATAADPLQKRLVNISPVMSPLVIPCVVAKRYHSLRYLADGSYGVVLSARDALAELHPALADSPDCAIKRCHNAFNSVHDAKHLLREVRLLAALDHPNILSLRDIDLPRSYAGWTDVYLVTPLVGDGGGDLSRRLAEHAAAHPDAPLPDAAVRAVVTGLARALLYMQSANVVHRDLKTANVLVRSDWTPVLCDLGLARAIDPEDTKAAQNLTTGVVTRSYRAPELFLTPSAYTGALDMWSVGCILHELLDVAQPLFVKRRGHVSELAAIFDVIGSPTDAEMAVAFPDAASRAYARRLTAGKTRARTPMRARFSGRVSVDALHPDALDLLERLLVLDPAARPTPADVLRHPYLAPTRDPAAEKVVGAARRAEIVAMEPPMKPTKDWVRRALWAEAVAYHPKEAALMEAGGTGPPP
jgi:serine/threonine protein kinase